MNKEKILAAAYQASQGVGNPVDAMADWIRNTLGVSGTAQMFGSDEEMVASIGAYLATNKAETVEQPTPNPISTPAVTESLKYPNRAYKRKCALSMRRVGSAVSAEDKFGESLDKILNEGDKLYNLIDEASHNILWVDLITEGEATRRNEELVKSDQPFRWTQR
jgi:hypothetical protein